MLTSYHCVKLTGTHCNCCIPCIPFIAKQALPLKEDSRERLVVSVGQFRPEKDHELQLQAFAELKQKGNQYKDVKLAMIGGCRNASDQAYLKKLQKSCSKLGLDSSVEFRLNVPHAELVSTLGRASVGLHTMWNEHFGIGVVEMMAAGVVTVAHNSGGPKADIIGPSSSSSTPPGYLAATAAEYADAMANMFGIVSTDKVTAIRKAGRAAAQKFSDDVFDTTFDNAFKPLIGLKR
jgi:alpha-1,2-mannosyltransferase